MRKSKNLKNECCKQTLNLTEIRNKQITCPKVSECIVSTYKNITNLTIFTTSDLIIKTQNPIIIDIYYSNIKGMRQYILNPTLAVPFYYFKYYEFNISNIDNYITCNIKGICSEIQISPKRSLLSSVPTMRTTSAPSESPTSSPTSAPTPNPSISTVNPTRNPTKHPTNVPTIQPTISTMSPTIYPTNSAYPKKSKFAFQNVLLYMIVTIVIIVITIIVCIFCIINCIKKKKQTSKEEELSKVGSLSSNSTPKSTRTSTPKSSIVATPGATKEDDIKIVETPKSIVISPNSANTLSPNISHKRHLFSTNAQEWPPVQSLKRHFASNSKSSKSYQYTPDGMQSVNHELKLRRFPSSNKMEGNVNNINNVEKMELPEQKLNGSEINRHDRQLSNVSAISTMSFISKSTNGKYKNNRQLQLQMQQFSNKSLNNKKIKRNNYSVSGITLNNLPLNLYNNDSININDIVNDINEGDMEEEEQEDSNMFGLQYNASISIVSNSNPTPNTNNIKMETNSTNNVKIVYGNETNNHI